MQRRTFLKFAVSSLTLALPPMAAAWLPDFSSIRVADTGLTSSHWQLISQVQTHLMPSEPNAPGAKEVNATRYLQWVLSDPGLEAERKQIFFDGADQLHALSQDKLQRSFQDLDENQRESILRQLEQMPGGADWLRELLHYLFEALFTDPVYGGNPNGVGWKWIGHRPGYKRPPADKRYFLL